MAMLMDQPVAEQSAAFMRNPVTGSHDAFDASAHSMLLVLLLKLCRQCPSCGQL